MIDETLLENAWQTFTYALRQHDDQVIGIAGREALRVVLERMPIFEARAEQNAERLNEIRRWKKLAEKPTAVNISLEDLGL